MELEFKENGAIYITTKEMFMKNKNRLNGTIGLYVMPEEDSIEIDNECDFWLCKQRLKKINGDINGK